jgi:hypothetical protein
VARVVPAREVALPGAVLRVVGLLRVVWRREVLLAVALLEVLRVVRYRAERAFCPLRVEA